MKIKRLLDRILSLPHVKLTDKQLDELFNRCFQIKTHGKLLTVTSFEESFTLSPATNLSKEDIVNLKTFIPYIQGMMKQLDTFSILLKTAYRVETGKLLAGDSTVPIMIAILTKYAASRGANPQKTLAELKLKLDLLQSLRDYYHFTSLGSAVQFCIHRKDNNDDSSLPHYQNIAEHLLDDDYPVQLYMLIKFQDICKNRMAQYYKDIYRILKVLEITDYNFVTEDVTPDDILHFVNENIAKMYGQLDVEGSPFKENEKLAGYVKKYIAYMEFFETVMRNKSPVLHRLVELTNKMQVYKDHLGDSVNELHLELSEEIKTYLEIPITKSLSIFNLFAARHEHDSKITLGEFIGYLTTKVEALILRKQMSGETTPLHLSTDDVHENSDPTSSLRSSPNSNTGT